MAADADEAKMSELGQTRRFRNVGVTSVYPSIADMMLRGCERPHKPLWKSRFFTKGKIKTMAPSPQDFLA